MAHGSRQQKFLGALSDPRAASPTLSPIHDTPTLSLGKSIPINRLAWQAAVKTCGKLVQPKSSLVFWFQVFQGEAVKLVPADSSQGIDAWSYNMVYNEGTVARTSGHLVYIERKGESRTSYFYGYTTKQDYHVGQSVEFFTHAIFSELSEHPLDPEPVCIDLNGANAEGPPADDRVMSTGPVTVTARSTRTGVGIVTAKRVSGVDGAIYHVKAQSFPGVRGEYDAVNYDTWWIVSSRDLSFKVNDKVRIEVDKGCMPKQPAWRLAQANKIERYSEAAAQGSGSLTANQGSGSLTANPGPVATSGHLSGVPGSTKRTASAAVSTLQAPNIAGPSVGPSHQPPHPHSVLQAPKMFHPGAPSHNPSHGGGMQAIHSFSAVGPSASTAAASKPRTPLPDKRKAASSSSSSDAENTDKGGKGKDRPPRKKRDTHEEGQA